MVQLVTLSPDETVRLDPSCLGDLYLQLGEAGAEDVVELTAEVADGWLPIFYSPERSAEQYGPLLQAGFDRVVLVIRRETENEIRAGRIAWLENMDARRADIMAIFEQTYGKDDAARWFQRWRIFFMACAELFGLDGGREWFVSHYLFGRIEDTGSTVA